jgi:hypothetical protein
MSFIMCNYYCYYGQVDSKKELEKLLKATCEAFIMSVTKLTVEPMLSFITKVGLLCPPYMPGLPLSRPMMCNVFPRHSLNFRALGFGMDQDLIWLWIWDKSTRRFIFPRLPGRHHPLRFLASYLITLICTGEQLSGKQSRSLLQVVITIVYVDVIAGYAKQNTINVTLYSWVSPANSMKLGPPCFHRRKGRERQGSWVLHLVKC